VKILVYDGTGLVLYSKRLEAGRFCWPSPADGVVRLSAAQLATLLEGLPWHRLQPRAVRSPEHGMVSGSAGLPLSQSVKLRHELGAGMIFSEFQIRSAALQS
jgi:transposase